MKFSRRKFIKIAAIGSAGFAGVAGYFTLHLHNAGIEKLFEENFDRSLEVGSVDNNLLNIRFYFINVKRKGGTLIPAGNGPSYMIVRLPQMHVSEKGFWSSDWLTDVIKNPNAVLSGYSFLAFRLWPKIKQKSEAAEFFQKTEQKIPFDLNVFLDWNDTNRMELITMVEWFELKGVAAQTMDFTDYINDNAAFRLHKLCDPNKFSVPVKEEKLQPVSDVFLKYRSIVVGLLDGNVTASNTSFVPVTLLDLPQGMAIVPVSRDEKGNLAKIEKYFLKNVVVNQEKVKEGRRRYEIWQNTLAYKRMKVPQQGKKAQTFTIEAPSFRAVGIIGDDISPHGKDTTECNSGCSADHPSNYLPSLLDKTELVYLTQYAKQANGNDFTGASFDIREVNGFFFTGLGVITHLHYCNLDNKPAGIDLIEYEHEISEGRDVFVRVARLGYNCKTGHRYKHVIEGRRKIEHDGAIYDGHGDQMHDASGNPIRFFDKPTSFIELKQYCECIEKFTCYTSEAAIWDKLKFEPVELTFKTTPPKGTVLLINPAVAKMTYPGASGGSVENDRVNPTHHRRLPFTDLNIIEKNRIPIDCLQDVVIEKDVCVLESLLWFWPIRENVYLKDTHDYDVQLKDYVSCVFTATDHEPKPVSSSTPFMFIRACVFEGPNPGAKQDLQNNYFKSSPQHDVFDERRLTYFNNQKIAFTPALDQEPDSKLLRAKDKFAASKVNILETVFIEHYFNVKDITVALGNKVPITTIKNIVYPQVLKVKVFIDHIKDLTQRKIPSVIEYHEDFIIHRFDEYKQEATALLGNGASLIMKNTEAFQQRFEHEANDTFNVISNVLQESKDKLGNLVIPDTVPESISLKELGVLSPKELKKKVADGTVVLDKVEQGLSKLKSFSPRELLRGKFSDICGLDLTAILDELLPVDEDGQNHTPLLEITKVANKVSDTILNSEVYKKIKEDLKIVQDKINDYDTMITDLTNTLEQARQQYNRAIKSIAELVPNADDFKNILKTKFEEYRTEAFNIILADAHFQDVKKAIEAKAADIQTYTEGEITIIRDTCDQKIHCIDDLWKDYTETILDFNAIMSPQVIGAINEVGEIVKQVNVAVNFVKNVYELYDTYIIKMDLAALQQFCKNNFTDLLVRVTEDNLQVTVDAKEVWYNRRTMEFMPHVPGNTDPAEGNRFTLLADDKAGKIQLDKKIEDLKVFIAKNLTGDTFQENVCTFLQHKLAIYQGQLDALLIILNKLSGTVIGSQGEMYLAMAQISDWLNQYQLKYERYENLLPANAKTGITKIKSLLKTAIAYIELIRKIDPTFYYQQRNRIETELKDVRRRINQDFLDEYEQLLGEVAGDYKIFNDAYKVLVPAIIAFNAAKTPQALADLKTARQVFVEANHDALDKLGARANKFLTKLANNHPIIKDLYDNVQKSTKHIIDTEKEYKVKFEDYQTYVKEHVAEMEGNLTEQIENYIEQYPNQVQQINEARNLVKLLKAVKQQDVTYQWNTTHFRDINLGIVTFKKFSTPDTKLKVDVRSTIHFAADKFPPVVERVEMHSENRLSDFGLTFLNILSIAFSEISFVAATGEEAHFQVKIKDVKFDGALSFVQAFESYLQTLGKGLILKLEGDHLALGYSLQLPAIQTPAFSFFNLSLNFDLRVYFDKRPLRFGFSLARADSKFGIAATIYAGFGFFGIVADPKHGIVEIECALEAGAWAGIHIGPISGEVKLAFGFYYRKNEFGVRIEGYIVAEGRLSVWILEVSARIYLGVVSENSVIEGVCTVSYSVKLGFIKKSFSGSFHKRIAGANSNNTAETQSNLASFHRKLHEPLSAAFVATSKNMMDGKQLVALYATPERNEETEETLAVSEDNWRKFITAF